MSTAGVPAPITPGGTPVSVVERSLEQLLPAEVRSVRWVVPVHAVVLEVGQGAWHGQVVGGDDPAALERAVEAAAAAAEQTTAAAAAAHARDEQREQQEQRARRERLWRERMREEAAAAALAMELPDTLASSWVADLAAASAGAGEPLALLDALRAAERQAARAEARRLALVVALVGAEPSGRSSAERQKAAEIALAAGISHAAAETLIHRARLLAGPFDCFGALLAEGRVSFGHCLALIAQTAAITDPDVLAAVAAGSLPHAGKVVAEFRREVDAVIAAVDPDVVGRRRTAREGRRVCTRRDRDGMSFLGLLHETAVINRLYAQLVEDGAGLLESRRAAAAEAAPSERSHGAPGTDALATDGDLSPDACRADALVARVLGHRQEDGTVTWDPAADQVVTVEVVIDLDTLNGLRESAALLDGEPVPAQVGRAWAGAARFFRRIVVDPVDGHLLDYGAAVYLPDPVRRFCLARDGGCREPGCTRRARRFLQLDHAEEFPGGPSSAANCGALCSSCHQRKTLGLTRIADSRADGTATVVTAWGQSVRIPPRRYLPAPPSSPPGRSDPGGPPEPLPDPPDPPPF